MRVVCTDNTGVENRLTVGRVYHVVDSMLHYGVTHYRIADVGWFTALRFTEAKHAALA